MVNTWAPSSLAPRVVQHDAGVAPPLNLRYFIFIPAPGPANRNPHDVSR
jgi:hypothetical protein